MQRISLRNLLHKGKLCQLLFNAYCRIFHPTGNGLNVVPRYQIPTDIVLAAPLPVLIERKSLAAFYDLNVILNVMASTIMFDIWMRHADCDTKCRG
jgi:hypothetical protein